ncbi:hypothetical protein FRB94_005093 [Tulasnella sp. JGI-2019a]|nr:hypothetical protein FRB94_005093 [Tulasnella sp. JGI-2019a]KAG9032558.1 hypothetical protein FRB95_001223 [Tulasnella sp. JGI-2019a]
MGLDSALPTDCIPIISAGYPVHHSRTYVVCNRDQHHRSIGPDVSHLHLNSENLVDDDVNMTEAKSPSDDDAIMVDVHSYEADQVDGLCSQLTKLGIVDASALAGTTIIRD